MHSRKIFLFSYFSKKVYKIMFCLQNDNLYKYFFFNIKSPLYLNFSWRSFSFISSPFQLPPTSFPLFVFVYGHTPSHLTEKVIKPLSRRRRDIEFSYWINIYITQRHCHLYPSNRRQWTRTNSFSLSITHIHK